MKFLPAMIELPEDGGDEFVRADVIEAVRAALDERAMFDLSVAKLPTIEAINYTPVPPNSDPVEVMQ